MSFNVKCSFHKDNDSHVIDFSKSENLNIDMEDVCNETITFLRNRFKKEIYGNVLDFYSCSDNLIECFIKNDELEKKFIIKIIMALKKHPDIIFTFSD